MKTIIHKAETRGHANHGWLDTHHTFSFAGYYNPERIHFGVLRVLNDDVVAPANGFDKHPHDNMEIITIPLKGSLEHKDSMGNKTVISQGEIQVMTAGTGIMHSEYNKSNSEDVSFLQIWVFPREKNLKPRYSQVQIEEFRKKDELFQIVSPDKEDQGAWINQDAWFNMGDLSVGWEGSYKLKKETSGVYIFLIDGKISVEGIELNKRDGIGISETDILNIKTLAPSKILLMELPVKL